MSQRSIKTLEDAVNNNFMYKEYESNDSVAGSGILFLTSDSSYIIKKNGKSDDLLNDLPENKFKFLEEKDLVVAKKILKIFVEEISKYPKIIGKKIPFFAFAMVKNLSQGGLDAGGVADRLVLYDVNLMNEDEGYARLVVHHEFAHVLDLNGLLGGSNIDSKTGTDLDWAKLNPDSNSYVNGYYTINDTHKPHPKDGFISSYSQTNTREDKAEVFSYMMDRSFSSVLDGWTVEDRILAKKREYLISSLNKFLPGFKDDLTVRVNTYGEPSDYVPFITKLQ